MVFNSLIFVAFFGAVYAAYLALGRHRRAQNILLLVGSYFFYGWWDYRFLGLLAASTIFDYIVARKLHRTESEAARRILVAASCAFNLGVLGIFKYFDFFSLSATRLLTMLGLKADPFTLNVILPIGISFYTFQTLGYTIDVYRRRLGPARDFCDFALYVSFFPQLVAGPIERAGRLLPQIERPRRVTIESVHVGLYLVLWGFFKKVVIADNVARVADAVFDAHADHTGLSVLAGMLAFTIQIYGDFSGYTDIARGISRLMGFNLMLNFRLPYFAVSPSDFWNRWHISLSSWLRDYLYISLGGNRRGNVRTLVNLMVVMLLGGLWHGASWNFVLWGGYHGLLLIVYRLFAPDLETRSRPVLAAAGVLMFALTVVGWVLFRSRSVEQVTYLLSNVSFALSPGYAEFVNTVLWCTAPLLVIQILQARSRNLLVATTWSWPIQALLYAALFVSILVFGVRDGTEFIYFQF